MQQRTVFCDDSVHEVEIAGDPLKIGEPPAGDQNHAILRERASAITRRMPGSIVSLTAVVPS